MTRSQDPFGARGWDTGAGSGSVFVDITNAVTKSQITEENISVEDERSMWSISEIKFSVL